jgi:hypothetical protein
MATFSITPNTVTKGDTITISWDGFEPTYSIIMESVSGPSPISSVIGVGPSGTKTEIVVMDSGVWVLRIRQPTPEGDIISNEVTFTINGGTPPNVWIVPALLAAGIVTIVGLSWWKRK